MKQLIFILSIFLFIGCAGNVKSINEAGNIGFSIDRTSDGGYAVRYDSGKEMSAFEMEFEMEDDKVKVKLKAKDIRAFSGIKESVKAIKEELAIYKKLIDASSGIISN